MDKATDQGTTLVGQGRNQISDAADNLGAAYLLHPAWVKVGGFRDRAINLRDDITAWLDGQPNASQ